MPTLDERIEAVRQRRRIAVGDRRKLIIDLATERERLRRALEPFAKLAGRYDPPEGDDADTCWPPGAPTMGDLRRARAALASEPRA